MGSRYDRDPEADLNAHSSIEPFIHRKVVVLDENHTVSVAARAMSDQQIGCVVVSDQNRHMVGIVTDRDLCCSVLAFHLDFETPLSEVMSPRARWANESSTISDVIEIMKEIGVRRVPVIAETKSHGEKCIGMVTLDDLILARVISPQDLQTIIRTQIHQRVHRAVRHERSDQRREHTLGHFYNVLARNMMMEPRRTEGVSLYLLRELIRRLPYTTAANFTAQLPSLLHEDLLNQPAGPDRSITGETLVNGVFSEFGFGPSQAGFLINGFWMGLKDFLKGSGETRLVLDQLPPDIRELLEGRELHTQAS
jgi:CBS domain-containing protein/uncharacterized protein (DUF2267 family)